MDPQAKNGNTVKICGQRSVRGFHETTPSRNFYCHS